VRLEPEKTDGERVYRIVAGKTSADAATQRFCLRVPIFGLTAIAGRHRILFAIAE
jgi:hypothetical protein